jgi:glyoxylase-like metal-dependent hydrolase (beta-lactamase superfamily II)
MCTTVVGAANAAESPVLSEKALTRVSDHVWAIMGFPNVGIIVGDRATLVVDTGLGPRNGALVARVARGLSTGSTLYLTTTHFHPEHAAGEGGFPKGTILIRPRIQEEELEAHAEESLARFRTNPDYAPLLEGATFRKPDIVFDKDYTLDLGNVHVQLMWLGPAHTKGDEEIFVIEDRTLLPGDVAMKNRPPRNFAEGSSPEVWIGILDRLAALKPLHLVPDHGELGDASIIADDRTYLQSLGTAPH